MTKTRLVTPLAPPPLPVFSQGVRKGPIVQVSGQGGADAAAAYPEGVADQTRQTLANVEAILQAGGAGFDDVVMLRVYLTTQADFPAMNAAYTEFMTADRIPSGVLPARTTVFVGLPFPQMLVEIDALAVVEN